MAPKVKRIPTGINGFDSLLEGGFPTGSCVLLAGSPGTAKTLFGTHFIYNGAKRFKEKGLYVLVGQSLDIFNKQALSVGMDLGSLKKYGTDVLYLSTADLDTDVSKVIIDRIKKDNIKRLVVDSLTTLSLNAPLFRSLNEVSIVDLMKKKSIFSPAIGGDSITKHFVYNFIDSIRDIQDCTSIVISESSEKGEYLTRDTVSEFMCDGIIQVTFDSMGGEFSRSLLVRKMRMTNNNEDVHPLEISSKGLVVHDIK